MNNEQYYNADYFNWQKNMGAFGGWANLRFFQPHIGADASVIDFGCGGGYLLNNLKCKEKLGVEINDIARQTIAQFGINSHKYTAEVADNWADVIISCHALEHVPQPLAELQLLKTKLKKGGKIIFMVPFDTYDYRPNDVNYHLYSWSAMNLGNLFTEAGFKVISSRNLYDAWPPFYQKIAKWFGASIFRLSCKIYGWWRKNKLAQSIVIAEKIDD